MTSQQTISNIWLFGYTTSIYYFIDIYIGDDPDNPLPASMCATFEVANGLIECLGTGTYIHLKKETTISGEYLGYYEIRVFGEYEIA